LELDAQFLEASPVRCAESSGIRHVSGGLGEAHLQTRLFELFDKLFQSVKRSVRLVANGEVVWASYTNN
jgi:hypothetical protein